MPVKQNHYIEARKHGCDDIIKTKNWIIWNNIAFSYYFTFLIINYNIYRPYRTTGSQRQTETNRCENTTTGRVFPDIRLKKEESWRTHNNKHISQRSCCPTTMTEAKQSSNQGHDAKWPPLVPTGINCLYFYPFCSSALCVLFISLFVCFLV